MAFAWCHRRLPAVVAAAALVAAACGGTAEPVPTTASPSTFPATTTTTTQPVPITTVTTTFPEPFALRLGLTPSLAFGIPFVLADPGTGIGRANGLEVTVEIFATPEDALAAAVAGRVDLVLPEARVMLLALAEGACFVAPMAFVDRDAMRLVGRSDLIAADDLIGRKVGTGAGGPGEVALRMWLSDQGVDWGEVGVVDTPAVDLPAALAGGLVDAVMWTEPFPAQALEACGDDCRYIGSIGESYREVAPVNVTCRWQQTYGDDGMERLVRAWLEGKEHLRNNLDAAAAITADRLRLTRQEVADRWRERGWLDAWGADLDDSQLEMLQAYAAYLVAAGDLAGAPEICSWVSSTWLRSVAPARVLLEGYDC